jgi:predicted nucleic acid-binding protein
VVKEQKEICVLKVIVDANIVFSAILNTNGKIGDILINSNNEIVFIAPTFLHQEISKYHSKLAKISGLPVEKIQEIQFHITRNIKFISEEQIKTRYWKEAYDLVSDIDVNDTPYIAYAKHFKCKLWSGDKKLIKGLESKNYKKIITTDKLYTWKIKHSKR